MLSQIVRPLVNPQVKLLAKSKATRPTLVKTVIKWLGFLGVEAEVTQLGTTGDKIQISLSVGKPDSASDRDWQTIVQKIGRSTSEELSHDADPVSIPPEQQTKYQSVIAYAIQISSGDRSPDWEEVLPQLHQLGLDDSTLLGVKSALKVPQYLDSLVGDLDADVAAVALYQTASIALRDRQIAPEEYQALQTLLETMADKCS